MLWDPKWEDKASADPFSLTSLILWLERQEPTDWYEYTMCSYCLLAQYFTACGFKDVKMGPKNFTHRDSPFRVDLPKGFNDIAASVMPSDWTFGAALNRARAIQCHAPT